MNNCLTLLFVDLLILSQLLYTRLELNLVQLEFDVQNPMFSLNKALQLSQDTGEKTILLMELFIADPYLNMITNAMTWDEISIWM